MGSGFDLSEQQEDNRLGSTGVQPLLSLPHLPEIVAEWAAVIPLVIHLATYRDDYFTTGEVSLMGRISIGLIPRLGTLSGLSRLLRNGAEFLDNASTKGGSSRLVWDVRWGSTFPCANGAAIAAIIDYALGKSKHNAPVGTTEAPLAAPDEAPKLCPSAVVKDTSPDTPPSDKLAGQTTRVAGQNEPEKVQSETAATRPRHPPPRAAASLRQTPGPRHPSIVAPNQFRRYQVLHVLRFRQTLEPASRRAAWQRLRLSLPGRVLTAVVLISLSILLFACGCYGTASTILISAASRAACAAVTVSRPPGYMLNNENHDACMLVAPHQNPLEWQLLIGDRGVVDTLLNKPMIQVLPGRAVDVVATALAVAHLLQLGAMTFTAAQKGWDGVFLVIILVADRTVRWLFRGKALGRQWLQQEGVTVEAKSFNFEGRTALLGALQLYSQSEVTRWMDDILVPHPRRDAWLRFMGFSVGDDGDDLDRGSVEWAQRARDLSVTGSKIMKRELDPEITVV